MNMVIMAPVTFFCNLRHEKIREAVRDMMAPGDDRCWMLHDKGHDFPWVFCHAVAKADWLGITVPEEYGGGGLAVAKARTVEHKISALGRGACARAAPSTSTSPTVGSPHREILLRGPADALGSDQTRVGTELHVRARPRTPTKLLTNDELED